MWLSVSVTTRKPRPGEQHGVHYFFVTDDEMDKLHRQLFRTLLSDVWSHGVESAIGRVTATLALIRSLETSGGSFGAAGTDGAVPLG